MLYNGWGTESSIYNKCNHFFNLMNDNNSNWNRDHKNKLAYSFLKYPKYSLSFTRFSMSYGILTNRILYNSTTMRKYWRRFNISNNLVLWRYCISMMRNIYYSNYNLKLMIFSLLDYPKYETWNYASKLNNYAIR
jgi:hypothetical protein